MPDKSARCFNNYYFLSGIIHTLDCAHLGSYWCFNHKLDTKPFTLYLQRKKKLDSVENLVARKITCMCLPLVLKEVVAMFNLTVKNILNTGSVYFINLV